MGKLSGTTTSADCIRMRGRLLLISRHACRIYAEKSWKTRISPLMADLSTAPSLIRFLFVRHGSEGAYAGLRSRRRSGSDFVSTPHRGGALVFA